MTGTRNEAYNTEPTRAGVAPAREVYVPEIRDQRGRLGGIDTIRALAATIVVFGHVGLFPASGLRSSHFLFRDMARGSAAVWNGPASVIVFFCISGFCIHLPFRGQRPMQPVPFLLRRLIRIGVPAIGALLFATYVLKNSQGLNNVIWSILCETIYYLLYPLLLSLGRRFGWLSLIGVSYAISFGLVFTHLQRLSMAENDYGAFGASLTWLIGLPCWLLGCWLAENERRFPVLSTLQITLLRVALFLLMVVLRVVKFHAHTLLASNCITLSMFAIVACLWLGYEISYFRKHPAPRAFEWMGEWSYSLYLMHPIAATLLLALGLSVVERSGSEILHLFTLGFAFLLAYLFHLLLEKPSHRLATMAGRAFSH